LQNVVIAHTSPAVATIHQKAKAMPCQVSRRSAFSLDALEWTWWSLFYADSTRSTSVHQSRALTKPTHRGPGTNGFPQSQSGWPAHNRYTTHCHPSDGPRRFLCVGDSQKKVDPAGVRSAVRGLLRTIPRHLSRVRARDLHDNELPPPVCYFVAKLRRLPKQGESSPCPSIRRGPSNQANLRRRIPMWL